MNDRLLKRDEVAQELTWRLEDIYPNEELWEKELQETKELAGKISAFEGHLADSAQGFYDALRLYDECVLKLDRVGGYSFMRLDQDTGNSHYQELQLKVQSAEVRISEELAYMEPEILAIPETVMERFYEEVPAIREYDVTIREIRRRKDHTLNKEMEQLLASAGEMAQTALNGFGMLADADLKFPSVTDRDGNEITISNGRFVPLQMSPDRELRKEVFEKFYTRYGEFKNTWAALYDGQIKQQIFYARARKYASTFEAAVDESDVEPAVCDRLIDSIHRGLGHMHRYVALRKKMLGVDELHMYDVYMPMVADYDRKFTYEEAKEISLKALAPLGEEYLAIVKKAYEDRWIDVYENEGKRSGAYSGGVYGVHPYMLLNYTDTLNDVFTLVHEMGHSMHTWYSEHAQSHLNARYKIFVAEVASTTNEILLLEYGVYALAGSGSQGEGLPAQPLSGQLQGNGLPPDHVRRVREKDQPDGGRGYSAYSQYALRDLSGAEQAVFWPRDGVGSSDRQRVVQDPSFLLQLLRIPVCDQLRGVRRDRAPHSGTGRSSCKALPGVPLGRLHQGSCQPSEDRRRRPLHIGADRRGA